MIESRDLFDDSGVQHEFFEYSEPRMFIWDLLLYENNRPVGAFSKSRQRSRSKIPGCPARHDNREAERVYHWRSAPLATVPGFGQPRHLVPLGRFPSRNFGGRTSIVMRSMLHRVLILSSSRPGDASGRETRAVSAQLVRPECLAIVLRSPQLPPPTPTGPPGRARLVLVMISILLYF